MGNDADDSALKKFDKTKKATANGVNRITIDSNVNVNLFASNTNDITAHLYGEVAIDCEPKFCIEQHDDEIFISVKSNGTSIHSNSICVAYASSAVVNNYSIVGNSGLTLDVEIPSKTFEKLSIGAKHANISISSIVTANAIVIDQKHGDINVTSNVTAGIISVTNAHGDVDLSATFHTLQIDCKHGDIDVDSVACSDTKLAIACRHGDVHVTLDNIRNSTVSVDTKHGSYKNNPKLKGMFNASGSITVKHGNAKFR